MASRTNSSSRSSVVSQTRLYSAPHSTLDTRERVIWAIDAFPDDNDRHIETASAIRALWPDADLFPVYVLSEESFNDRGYSNFLRPALKPMAQKALEAILDGAQAQDPARPLGLRPPRILIERSSSRANCAKRLIRYAERIHATQIAVGSHARGAITRFLVGSFSDAILQNSSMPVLINGPASIATASNLRTIIFATDYSEACRQAYEEVLDLAERTGAELHLFHKPLPAPLDLYALGGAQMLEGGWLGAAEALDQTANDLREKTDHWMDWALSRGVACRSVRTNFGEPTADAIVRYCDQLDASSTLIALVSQAGAFASAFLGSVTREVLRASPAPLYLLPRSENLSS